MKILLSSYAFYPSVGGLEAVSAMLADQFCLRGHEVIIITQTDGNGVDAPYKVVRRPTKRQLFKLVGWCDVFLHNNINLRSAFPLLFHRRPWVIINNGSVQDDLKSRIKSFLARFATTSGVSQDTARKIGSDVVIPNCYDEGLFRELTDVKREVELMYLGRLVSEKGVDILLRALHQLKLQRTVPKLTIVGGGPEEAPLRKLASSLDLDSQVTFAGIKRGEELVRELNRHIILVVPSRYDEPFGIVALEGLACGCVVVGSEGGGLKEAIGPCGMTFPNGDVAALASALKDLLTSPGLRDKLTAGRNQHLERFRPEFVAKCYLEVFETAMRN